MLKGVWTVRDVIIEHMVCEENRAQGVFSSSDSHTLVYKGLLCRRAFGQSEL